jgi:hypothetical protein
MKDENIWDGIRCLIADFKELYAGFRDARPPGTNDFQANYDFLLGKLIVFLVRSAPWVAAISAAGYFLTRPK